MRKILYISLVLLLPLITAGCSKEHRDKIFRTLIGETSQDAHLEIRYRTFYYCTIDVNSPYINSSVKSMTFQIRKIEKIDVSSDAMIHCKISPSGQEVGVPIPVVSLSDGSFITFNFPYLEKPINRFHLTLSSPIEARVKIWLCGSDTANSFYQSATRRRLDEYSYSQPVTKPKTTIEYYDRQPQII